MIQYDHLLGRQFSLGTTDCYGLIRDFFKDNYRIDLRNYARPSNFWDHGFDLYGENFRREGFEPIDVLPRQLRVGDCFLIAIYVDSVRRTPVENRERRANHAAVYIGEGKILHHFVNRLSNVENYQGRWRNMTVATLRHKQVPLANTSSERINYLDLMPSNKRSEIERVLATAKIDRDRL